MGVKAETISSNPMEEGNRVDHRQLEPHPNRKIEALDMFLGRLEINPPDHRNESEITLDRATIVVKKQTATIVVQRLTTTDVVQRLTTTDVVKSTVLMHQ